jgi:hypothetical protein
MRDKQSNRPRPLTWGFGARREGFEPSTARSVAWCFASIWSGPDGSGLLRLDASSVQTAPDRSCRIVWMIRRMIKQAGSSTNRGGPSTRSASVLGIQIQPLFDPVSETGEFGSTSGSTALHEPRLPARAYFRTRRGRHHSGWCCVGHSDSPEAAYLSVRSSRPGQPDPVRSGAGGDPGSQLIVYPIL